MRREREPPTDRERRGTRDRLLELREALAVDRDARRSERVLGVERKDAVVADLVRAVRRQVHGTTRGELDTLLARLLLT